jgi:GH18 family chitinase
MKTRLLLLILVCAVCLMLSGGSNQIQAQSNIWVTAYYAGWMQSTLPASAIDYTAMTHINYFAIVPNADGSINLSGNGVTYNANAQTLVSNAHAHGVKVIITVGGWSTESAFNSASASASTRATFINNLMNVVRQANYDGIDVDWEPLATGDQTNYANLAHDLRDSLTAQNPALLLTMATQWAANVSAATYQYFDQVNLMTYDLAGLWSGWVTWHNSALYNDITIGTQTISCDGMVKKWNSAGVPLNKLGIGIDWYGYKYSGVTGPRQSITGGTLVQGNRDYATIMSSDYPTMTRVWDDAAQAAYLTNSSGWITYDDQQTCKAKIDYAKTKGIGGVIIWELGGGYRKSLAAGARDSLLQAVKNALGGVVTPSDSVAPSVAITAPANGSSLSGTVAVSVTASDNVGVAGVQFQLNGANLGSEVTTSPYNYSWNTALKSNGSYTLSAVARDAAGNKTTASITVTLSNAADTAAPSVSFTAPTTGATVSGTYAVKASASDNVAVIGVQFKLDGVNLGSEVTTSPYNYSWNTTSKSNGAYTLSAVARDAAGNTKTASISVTVSNIPDTTAPSVSFTAPTDGASVSGTITVSASASDNVGVAGVQFKLNGANLGSEITTVPYTYSWNTTLNTNGTYTLSAVARDAAGNTSTVSITVVDTNAIPLGTSAFAAVATDNFNRTDQPQLTGARWSSILNQPGKGTMRLVNQEIQAYDTIGVGYGGGVVWDSAVTKGSGVSLTVSQRSGDNSYTSLFIYARMSSKDLNTGNGYRFRYVDNSSGTATLSIQKVTGGTNGTDLVTTNYQINVGDSLRFIVQNDAPGTLTAFVNSTQVLSVVDTTYNPASWYYWVRGMVLAASPTFDNFALMAKIPTPLPIQLASFAAVASGPAVVELNWATVSEVNNYGFYIERRSQSETSFRTIGNFIPGAGTSLEQHQYSCADSTVSVGTYYYRLKQVDLNGDYTYSSEIVVTVTGAMAVGDDAVPYQFALLQNYPNPFNPTTEIKFTVQNAEHAAVIVYNMLGQQIAKLFDGVAEPGRYYTVQFNGGDFGSGIYMYRIVTDSHVAVRKMVLVK